MKLTVTFEGHLSDLAQLQPADLYARKKVLSLRHSFESGVWRRDRFVDMVLDDLCLTALNAEERASLIMQGEYFTMLRAAAGRLRLVDSKLATEGSEVAEIALYGVMKDYYKALPVVPKIFYKQNRNDNAKGSDSVHLVLDSENQFSVWLGEAKFFNSGNTNRFGEIIKSVIDGLQPQKLRKENSIISGLDDLGKLLNDPAATREIRDFLESSTTLDEIKKKLHVPILLIHECELTKSCTSENEEYLAELTASHKKMAVNYLKRQAKKSSEVFGYTDISFHLILIPVDSKDDITESFINKAKYLRAE